LTAEKDSVRKFLMSLASFGRGAPSQICGPTCGTEVVVEIRRAPAGYEVLNGAEEILRRSSFFRRTSSGLAFSRRLLVAGFA